MRISRSKPTGDDVQSRRHEIVSLLALAVIRQQQISANDDSSAESSGNSGQDGLIESENDRSL